MAGLGEWVEHGDCVGRESLHGVDSGTMRSEGSNGTAASPLACPPAARHWPERHARK